MNDETNLDRRQDLQHDEDAFRLYQEEKRLRAAKSRTSFIWIINSISSLGGMLEILLGLRLLLRLLGANSQNEVAQWINNLSAPFVSPFSSLFANPTLGSKANILDANILIAMLAYGLAVYLAVSLVRFIFIAHIIVF